MFRSKKDIDRHVRDIFTKVKTEEEVRSILTSKLLKLDYLANYTAR